MKTMTEESLQRKLARLESALDTERARLRKACDKIPWGAGMRRTKCTPSFRRENELIEKIKVVTFQPTFGRYHFCWFLVPLMYCFTQQRLHLLGPSLILIYVV